MLERATRDHPQRVQNSVFECLLDAAQYAVFKAQLTALIDPDADWSQDDVLLV